MADRLTSGQTLGPNERIESYNRKAALVMQGDGNFVLYDTFAGKALWASGTDGKTGASVTMQGDGNLVVYAPDGQAVWDAQTTGNAGDSLVVQDDGNAVVYGSDGRALWDSNTSLGPLTVSTRWDHPNGEFHMEGDAYLTAGGQLRADITTWTTSIGRGFTGGCQVSVIDGGENIIHQWLIWPLGVDSRGVWWKRSRRSDHPYEQIDPALAAQAKRIEMWFSHMGKDRWDDILGEINKKAADLKALYEKFASNAG